MIVVGGGVIICAGAALAILGGPGGDFGRVELFADVLGSVVAVGCLVVNPVVAVLLGWWLLDEPLGARTVPRPASSSRSPWPSPSCRKRPDRTPTRRRGATVRPARSLTTVMRRRVLLTGGAALTGGVVLTGAAGYRWFRGGPQEINVPDVPPGDERLERKRSAARARTVDFYTAVPDGHGDGRGLPVCLVLHGGSTTAADFPRLGLARFLTQAVRAGAPPFVLAGATGDRLAWRPSAGDDPQRMVHEEIPAWCAARGFDTARIAACGWSMGGYGSLLLAETFPGFTRAVAAFSPAVTPGDAVFAGAAALRGTPVGLWCGRQDGLADDVRALARVLGPVAGSFGEGRHNFAYWSTCLPAAFSFIGSALTPPAPGPAASRPATSRPATFRPATFRPAAS